jgi:outer membrane protein assembly factor BamE (lipoprotein component of BamABCDE complex)
MKTWLILAATLALTCLVIPACKPSPEGPSGPQTTQARPDMGIRPGMTAQEVETKLGKPSKVANTFEGNDFTAPPGKLYSYDRRPQGVFLVYLDKNGAVTSTGWIDR